MDFSFQSSADLVAPPIVLNPDLPVVDLPPPIALLPAPAIDALSPAGGGVGTVVTIYGRNFTGVNTNPPGLLRGVFFTGSAGVDVRAPLFSATDSYIATQVPVGAATGPVKVYADGGLAVSAVGFGVPVVGSSVALALSPAAVTVVSGGSVSCSIALARSNYSGPVSLQVGGLPTGAVANIAPNPVSGNTALLTISTAAWATTLGSHVFSIGGMAGSVPVSPVSALLTVNPPAAMPPPAPRVNGYTPAMGPGGSLVAVFGSNFVPGSTQVSFNGIAAEAYVVSATQLNAVVPLRADTGPIAVTTPSGTAISATPFVVTRVIRGTGFDPYA